MSYVFKAGPDGATDVKITNLPVGTSEVSHLLVDGLKQLLLKTRNGASIQMAFVSGESTTKFITIPGGNSRTITDLYFTGKTLYITASSNDILEIEELYT